MSILDGSSSGSPGIGLTSIAWPLDLPIFPASRRITMRKIEAVASDVSPFTGGRQVQEWPSARWGVDVELPTMYEYDARVWSAWFGALRGVAGTFLIGDRTRVLPRGLWGAMTPLVNGAGQTGRTLNVKGLTASTSLVARSGDYLQLGAGATSRLHEVLLDANSDASGNATLNIWPALRESPVDSSAIVVSGARGRFHLTSNLREISIDEAMQAQIKFSAEEEI
jgi:hypothetical protein